MRALIVTGLLTLATAAPASGAPTPVASATTATREADRFFGLPRGNRAVAAGLSLALSGLGQHYNGEGDKGQLMMASLLSFPIAYGLDALSGGATMRVFSYALLVSVKSWSVWDAYQGPRPAPSPSSP